MDTLSRVLGNAADPEMAETLHRVSHSGRVEYLTLDAADMKRHRLRAQTDAGAACAIALPRDQKLCNGAILLIEPQRAIVVRLTEQPVLRIQPSDAASALELGYLAGNMHWRVAFDGATLEIAQEGDQRAYLARLAPLLESGRAHLVDHAG
ncbi:MAG: urease accessory protein UreE [Alphaproteobacteria bacterium]